MSKSSVGLSNRIFFTVDYCDGTGYIGELDGRQKRLVNFTNSELVRLCNFFKEHKLLEDIESEDNISSGK